MTPTLNRLGVEWPKPLVYIMLSRSTLEGMLETIHQTTAHEQPRNRSRNINTDKNEVVITSISRDRTSYCANLALEISYVA